MPSAGAIVRRSCAVDVDEHVEQLQDWNLRYEQLDEGRFSGQFTDVRWPGVQLFVEKTTRRIRQRGLLRADSIGFGMLLDGKGDVAVNAVRAGAGSLIACDSTELDICTPTECTLAGIVIDAPVLRGVTGDVALMEGVLRPGAMLSMTPPAAEMARWRTLLLDAVSALTARPGLVAEAGLRRQLEQDLLAGLVDAVSAACRDDQVVSRDQRKRVVDRACDLFLERPDDPPTLAEVCLRVGASPRKLGYCFQDVLGISPARYVKSVRLNAVRRELSRLRDPETSVYDVAARWGFWHFGHFSSDYKRQFAELPSETLRRGRERGAA
jgi:AraC family ethanolamine operon transcriptional activator